MSSNNENNLFESLKTAAAPESFASVSQWLHRIESRQQHPIRLRSVWSGSTVLKLSFVLVILAIVGFIPFSQTETLGYIVYWEASENPTAVLEKLEQMNIPTSQVVYVPHPTEQKNRFMLVALKRQSNKFETWKEALLATPSFKNTTPEILSVEMSRSIIDAFFDNMPQSFENDIFSKFRYSKAAFEHDLFINLANMRIDRYFSTESQKYKIMRYSKNKNGSFSIKVGIWPPLDTDKQKYLRTYNEKLFYAKQKIENALADLKRYNNPQVNHIKAQLEERITELEEAIMEGH